MYIIINRYANAIDKIVALEKQCERSREKKSNTLLQHQRYARTSCLKKLSYSSRNSIKPLAIVPFYLSILCDDCFFIATVCRKRVMTNPTDRETFAFGSDVAEQIDHPAPSPCLPAGTAPGFSILSIGLPGLNSVDGNTQSGVARRKGFCTKISTCRTTGKRCVPPRFLLIKEFTNGKLVQLFVQDKKSARF
jgi:hypothetical protein